MRTTLRLLAATVLAATALTVAPIRPVPAAAASGCAIGRPAAAYTDEVATSPGHARVWRLYQAFFLRQPDRAGIDYWFKTRARGARLDDLAYAFAASDEFRARYGNLTHSGFVDLVYRNVLCRPADSAGRSYWTGLLRTGRLTRWDMVVNFVELREYLTRTGTCHSIYPAETAAVDACYRPPLRPLAHATLSADGYQAHNGTIGRVRGGTGSFRGVLVDGTRGLLATGSDRCGIASINANWVLEAEKDRANPTAIGLGVVDGRHQKGSRDRLDRGILGQRFTTRSQNVVEVWPGDTLSPDDQRLSSVLHRRGTLVIESWLPAAERSPYLTELRPDLAVGDDGWVWAAAGTPLIIGGQRNKNFDRDYVNDPYSLQTLRHPFVAHDRDTGRFLIAATANVDARDLVVWAERAGWEELIKFDGGGSAEFNVARRAVVGGTSRDLPVWLGVGC